MYRPEFAFPTPEGYVDEVFTYYFDATNTPALNRTFASGEQSLNIPLLMQQDAPFIWLATLIDDPDNVLGVQFQDPNRNFLSDSFVPVNLSYAGCSPTPGVPGNNCVTQDPVVCPAGSVIYLNVKNLS